MSKKKKEQADLESKQEKEERRKRLLADLQERVKNNKGKPLSQRQLKKTTYGDITYEKLVQVIGFGDPKRLQKVMEEIAGKAKAEPKRKDERKVEPVESSAMAAAHEAETSREVSQLTEKPKRRRWTRYELIVFLRGKYRELGRVPMQKDIHEWSKQKLCPSYPTCMKVLEVDSKAEWNTLLEEQEH